jgi:hypothetical protein
MRRVSSRFIRGVAVCTVVVLLFLPVFAFADDSVIQPPGAKIGPPQGGSGYAGIQIQPPVRFSTLDWLMIVWLAVRIGPAIT